VGRDHFELFGLTTDQVAAWRATGYRPWEVLQGSPVLQEVVELVSSGQFSDGDRDLFGPLLHGLLQSDSFFVLADFEAYLQAQQRIDGRWLDQRGWRHSSLMNTARSGFFSSDRSIQDYADRVWKVDPMPVELACSLPGQGVQQPSF
jgi:starch phosphorylase